MARFDAKTSTTQRRRRAASLIVVLAIGTSIAFAVSTCDQRSGRAQADPTGRDGSANPTDSSGDTTASDGDDSAADTATSAADTGTDTDVGTSATAALLPLAAQREVDEGRFATAAACATCHSNSPDATAMRTADGTGVGHFDLWQATMMANAGRDPVWRAVVSAEIAATPAAAEAIQSKCTQCHAPMAWTEADRAGDPPAGLGWLDPESSDPRAQLALDGVSCAACHQIQDVGLGTESSFSGGYTIGDDREIYGPHSAPFARPMEMRSGFAPVVADHIRGESGTCATCHTLFTNDLDPSGAPIGNFFPEQTPYLEWRNSDFNTEIASPTDVAQTCQGCHVPTFDAAGNAIFTRIARRPDGSDFPPVTERAPFGRHLFVGGNTLVPRILRDYADVLRPQASTAAFDQVIAAARDQLGQHTATLTLSAATRDASGLQATITVGNLAGHKVPTGFPARRLFLELEAVDGSGAVVWAVGRTDAYGHILDAAGAPLASERAGGPTEPHRTVTTSGAPMIWEAIMADAAGAPTWTLLRAATYHKDNRLLPRGWRDDHADAVHTAPAGLGDDADFVGGEDRIALAIPAEALPDGPVTVRATLHFQPVGARFVAELATADTPEVRGLIAVLERDGLATETVATASVTVP